MTASIGNLKIIFGECSYPDFPNEFERGLVNIKVHYSGEEDSAFKAAGIVSRGEVEEWGDKLVVFIKDRGKLTTLISDQFQFWLRFQHQNDSTSIINLNVHDESGNEKKVVFQVQESEVDLFARQLSSISSSLKERAVQRG